MATTSLAVFGSPRKPPAANALLRHLVGVSSLTELFALRLQQEMDSRGLSANALAKLSGVGQRSISRILKGEQSPGLDMVDQVARALGLPAVWLLEARSPSPRTDKKVVHLPNPYPPIFAAKQHEGKYRLRRNKKE